MREGLGTMPLLPSLVASDASIDLQEPYSEAALRTWVSRITWQPGTEVVLLERPSRFQPLSLLVHLDTWDTRSPEPRKVLITHNIPLPNDHLIDEMFSTFGRFLDWVRKELYRVSKHESDEWLKVDGRMIFNPHQ